MALRLRHEQTTHRIRKLDDYIGATCVRIVLEITRVYSRKKPIAYKINLNVHEVSRRAIISILDKS